MYDSDFINITCGKVAARLVMEQFICPGIHQKCIDVDGKRMTPKAFCVMGEKEKLKDWKNAIRLDGRSMRKRMDRGDIDFYKHDEICTGRCMSRNYGPSKYDVKIENLRMATEEGNPEQPEWPPLIPSVNNLDGPAYNILREARGHSPEENSERGPVGHPVFPGQDMEDCLPSTSLSESASRGAGVNNLVIKPEPMWDNETVDELGDRDSASSNDVDSGMAALSKIRASIGLSTRRRRKPVVPKQYVASNGTFTSVKPGRTNKNGAFDADQTRIVQLVAELPDTESLLEDSVAFWHGIRDLGLLDDIVRDVKHSVEVIKNDMVKHSINENDARQLSNVVTDLGLVTKLKWRLAEHKTRTENEKAKILHEIEALKMKVAQSEQKQKELKRKSECFDNFLENSRPKRTATSTPNSMISPSVTGSDNDSDDHLAEQTVSNDSAEEENVS